MFDIEYHLKYKFVNKEYEGELLSTEKYKNDAGLDLHTPKQYVIPPKSQVKIKLGIICELKKVTSFNFETNSFSKSEPSSFLLMPRSSISKTPLRMSNSIGLIDAGYRGELMAVCDNISEEEYVLEEGTRLFQIVNPDLKPFGKIVVSDDLTKTDRGEGGFGSTGKN